MRKKQKLWSVLLIVSMLMVFIPAGGGAQSGQAGSPSGLGVVPEFLSDPDNSDPCGDGWNSVKIESKDFKDGEYSDGILDLTYTVTDGIYVEWTSNIPINVVIVKGGPVGNLYDYGSQGVNGDSWLHAPVNLNSGKYYGISYVAFCYYVPPKQIVPILECITDNGDGTYTAYWGYANFYHQTLDALESSFTGNVLGGTTTPPSTGFLPGRHKSVFSTVFDGEDLAWSLTGPDGVNTTIIANDHSPFCEGDEPLLPVLECVEDLGDGLYRAWWGYKNDNPFVVNAEVSTFTGDVVGETTTPPLSGFLPGRHQNVFSTVFSTVNSPNLVWTLQGPDGKTRVATASASSKQCVPEEALTVESLCRGTGHLTEIDWIINNPNDVHITVTWEVEGQTGEHTAPPGISLFTTIKVPGSPNTLTLYFEGTKMAVLPRACYQPLILEALCSEDPDNELKWKITNPNSYAVEVTWKILLSNPQQKDTITLAANSEHIFYTETIPDDPNIGMIFVDGVLQGDSVAANFTPCPGDTNGGPIPVPEQEIISLPDLGVPSLPGTEIILEDVEEFELELFPEIPAVGLEEEQLPLEEVEELPATSAIPEPYLPTALLLFAAGYILRKKKS